MKTLTMIAWLPSFLVYIKTFGYSVLFGIVFLCTNGVFLAPYSVMVPIGIRVRIIRKIRRCFGKGKFLFRLNSTIKAKLITICVLMLTIPMLVITIFNYRKSSKSPNELRKTNLKNSVELTII